MRKIKVTTYTVYAIQDSGYHKWFDKTESEEEAIKMVKRSKKGNRYYVKQEEERTIYDSFNEACAAWDAQRNPWRADFNPWYEVN